MSLQEKEAEFAALLEEKLALEKRKWEKDAKQEKKKQKKKKRKRERK